MQSSMHLLFWLYKSKQSRRGLYPIYMRITVWREKTEVSTGIDISPSQWNSKKAIINGTSNQSKALNTKLQQLKDKVLDIYNVLTKSQTPLSPEYKVRWVLFNLQRV